MSAFHPSRTFANGILLTLNGSGTRLRKDGARSHIPERGSDKSVGSTIDRSKHCEEVSVLANLDVRNPDGRNDRSAFGPLDHPLDPNL